MVLDVDVEISKCIDRCRVLVPVLGVEASELGAPASEADLKKSLHFNIDTCNDLRRTEDTTPQLFSNQTRILNTTTDIPRPRRRPHSNIEPKREHKFCEKNTA